MAIIKGAKRVTDGTINVVRSDGSTITLGSTSATLINFETSGSGSILQFQGAKIQWTSNPGNNYLLGSDSVDGSDNRTITIASDNTGQLVSRGAYLWIGGNESSLTGGWQLITGNNATADGTLQANRNIAFNTAGSTRLLLDSTGNIYFGPTNFTILADTSDGSDTKAIRICGGGSASDTRGAYAIINGNETGDPGRFTISAGNISPGCVVDIIAPHSNGQVFFRIGGSISWRINSSQILPEVTNSYDIGATGSYIRNAYLQGILAGSGHLIYGGTAQYHIKGNTSDGSDNSSIVISGGGGVADTRGGYVAAFGNEHAGAGKVQIVSGEAGTIDFHTGSGSGLRWSIASSNGYLLPNGNYTRQIGSSTANLDAVFSSQIGTGDATDLGFYTDNSTRWRVKNTTGHYLPETNNTYEIGSSSLRVKKLWAVDADISGSLTASLTLSSITYSSNPFGIQADTSDGSDTKSIFINSGGAAAPSRGGGIEFYGNEHANTGIVHLYSGAATGAKVRIGANSSDQGIEFSTNASLRWSINSVGQLFQNATNGGDLIFNAANSAIQILNGASLDADVTTSSPTGRTVMYIGSNTTGTNLAMVANGANTSPCAFYAFKTRAAANSWNANTIVSSGDNIFELVAWGADGANYIASSGIQFKVDVTPGSGSVPGRIELLTHDGSALRSRWRINSTGQFVQDATYGGDIVFNATGFEIKAGTSDGSDNLDINIYGGGGSGSSRGASIQLAGNEHASIGNLNASAGDASGACFYLNAPASNGKIRLGTAGVNDRFVVSNDGKVGISKLSPTFWLDIVGGNGNDALRLAVNAAGSTTLRLDTFDDVAETANNKNWAFRNRYNEFGTLELMRSTTSTGDPTTTVMSWQKDSTIRIFGNLVPNANASFAFGSSSLNASVVYTRQVGSGDSNLILFSNNGTRWTVESDAAGSILYTPAGQNAAIFVNTSDGSDNSSITISGAPRNTSTALPNEARGAGISLFGNESGAGFAGGVVLQPGSSGYIYFRTGSTPTTRWIVYDNGHILPNSGNSYDVGSPSFPVRTFHGYGASMLDDTSAPAGLVICNATHASFTGRLTYLQASRSANSAYTFGQYYSAAGGDVEFNFRGDGNAFCDGAFTGGGADYAEYFESSDGETIAIGKTVVLDGTTGKVREYDSGEDDVSDIFGVIRPKQGGASTVGNSPLKWHNKYLRTEFGAYILDENGERQLNPEFDEELDYESREERDEWVLVGLLGQIPVIATEAKNPNWKKMKDISGSVELWLVK